MTGQMSQSEQRAVWKVSGEIAEAVAASHCASALGQEVMAAIDRLVECDFGSILSAVPQQEWVLHGQKEDNETIRRNHWRYGFELEPAELQQLSTTFSRDSDTIPLPRRERLSVYADFLAPNRQSSFVARYWFMGGRAWGVGMSRGSLGFSARDLERLEAIFPQVRAALRASTWLKESGENLLGSSSAMACSLTPAQKSVAALVMRGLTNKEVASLLGLSPNTVRNALSEVFEKVGASRRSELGFVLCGGALDGTSSPVSRRGLDIQLGVFHTIQAAPASSRAR